MSSILSTQTCYTEDPWNKMILCDRVEHIKKLIGLNLKIAFSVRPERGFGVAVCVSEGSLTHGDLWSGVNWINSG